MKPGARWVSLSLALGLCVMAAAAGPLDKAECIVGAKPGGGFDLSCKLAQAALTQATVMAGKHAAEPMRVSYMPGGIGAVAFNTVVAQRPAEANTIVAFSSGSLLNLAQGKFGRYRETDVRWLAAVGADFGAVMVADSSRFKSLKDLMAALRADPNKVVFGAGGTVGSQDWLKAALTVRAAGVNHKAMRFVAFEGGGEAIAALQGGHIHVLMGDVAESMAHTAGGATLRMLAVMSDQRLPGVLAGVPTAREQGFDLQWPIMRGFYMGPKVSDADFGVWRDTFRQLLASPAYDALRSAHGLLPLALTGAALDAHVLRQVQDYRRLVTEFGLRVPP
ncbi:Bug family tripartite tricarboxylate transporter substrate binding protein [Aquabacterium sp.]|uniref:Bug family tripartite tricarboxylate transporter substrate binding protein n=1 Tax=Aquabacterium sp. TaxID=1872578 RepID=UPI002B51B1EC|nr:tripartite tricarboxylate transporter substrate-binding protein [Aquabacterium sp.]HSW09244.1 tripartite tricarboxylate transporter substrate-binding protein [Aquabacterium sp.]